MSNPSNFSGKVFLDKYIVISKIGSGSFSEVWLSYNIKNKLYYAIKIQNIADYDEGVREIELFKKIKITHCQYFLVLVEDFIYETEEGKHICMILELMACSTYDIIKNYPYKHGLPFNIVKKIIYQTFVAVDTLHEELGIIHTDLKPENLLLVGVNKKVQTIIDIFNGHNFEKMYKKNKKKILKKKPNSESIPILYKLALNNTAMEIVQKTILDSSKKLEDVSSDESFSEISSDDGSDTSSSSKVSRYLIDSSESEEYDIKSINEAIVDDVYIQKAEIKLSDFGNCCENDDKFTGIIQTRYYRAPEIILKCPYDNKCDMWSIGCTIYELLTGEILFNPEKDDAISRDRYHIYEMQSKLGKIPNEIISKSKRRDTFFCKNGSLRGIKKINYKLLWDSLFEKFKNRPDISNDELLALIDLLLKLFEYNTTKRYSAKQCLNHMLFNKNLKKSIKSKIKN